MKYNFNEIEAKWQKYWAKNKTFAAKNPENGAEAQSPKFYVLDMFPYPSGAGLHVGHPLGYIASDIYARYKRHQGFNVLHPMGYDSFGLPAEQYAIQTGQHPAITTEANIKRYREQLDNMGFSFDWDREVRTSDPNYYKWTQWIFIQLFNSWYNKDTDKAEDISTLVSKFEFEGNANVNAVCDEDVKEFTAAEWKNYSSEDQQKKLLKYRLTYLAEAEVNWCPALGTVLANDEIVNGVSERGGHPVVRKKMTQWSMRISAYAQRLIDGLDKLDWPQPLKDSQINWIGRSEGASVEFRILPPTPSKGGGGSPGYLTGKPEIASLLLERAKEMRANPTKAESALWQCLKGKKLDVKFRQQHLIDAFIADFVCLDRKLIIEVDGDIHDFQQEKDKEREDVLKELGYTILRFKNEEVLGDIDSVISKIKNKLKVLPSGKDLGWEISVFTTRPDTIFGVTFMTLAPELELVKKITTPEQKAEVDAYIEATAKRSERDRMADVKTITGAFTGAYAEHPFTGEAIPIWIGDYVLAGYGTGAVMAVPSGDQRDYDFAKHFNIPIINIFEGIDISEGAYAEKDDTKLVNSGFLNGFSYKEATRKIIDALEEKGVGKGKINYRLRDAVFSRQRYWGEPFPVYYVNGLPQMIDKKHLPIELPEVEKYLPTETGEPPLGNATEWAWDTKNNKVVSNNLVTLSAVEGSHEDNGIYPLELNTMPGWAGSSWYFNRYMDAGNTEEFASQEALNYWKDVDLYIGGSEHATGHLLYSRFWQKFLYDRGLVPVDEYAKKLINQGMILGESAFFRTLNGFAFYKNGKPFAAYMPDPHNLTYSKKLISEDLAENQEYLKKEFIERKPLEENSLKTYEKVLLELNEYEIEAHRGRVDVEYVNVSNELDLDKFLDDKRYKQYKDYQIIKNNNGSFKVHREVEKMSKSKYNVVNPDDICKEYGADTLRLYEMFLGPLEQAKPWNTAGITGVHSFLKKLWRLYFDDNGLIVTDTPPLEGQGEALKTLHKTIKKVREDIENFSFNTSVSAFMIAVNELTAQKCHSRAVLEPLAIIISPYAPHIAEELWEALGNAGSISKAPFPEFEEKYLVESSKEYPVSFNGKTRFKIELPLDMNVPEIEKAIMADERTQQQLQGREPKKVIIVPGKIINIVG